MSLSMCGELTLSGCRVELNTYTFFSKQDKRNISDVTTEMFKSMKSYEGHRVAGKHVYLKEDVEKACAQHGVIPNTGVHSSVRLHMRVYPSTSKLSPFIYEKRKEEKTSLGLWGWRVWAITAAAADPLDRIRSLSFVPKNPNEQQTWFYQKTIFPIPQGTSENDCEEEETDETSDDKSNNNSPPIYADFIKPFDDFDSNLCRAGIDPLGSFPSNVRTFTLDPKKFDSKKTAKENVDLIACQATKDIKEEEQDTKEETLSSRIHRIVWYFFNDIHAVEVSMTVQLKESALSQIHFRKESRH